MHLNDILDGSVRYRKQSYCSVASVVMPTLLGRVRRHQQTWLCAIRDLDLAFLVHSQRQSLRVLLSTGLLQKLAILFTRQDNRLKLSRAELRRPLEIQSTFEHRDPILVRRISDSGHQ